MNQLLRFIIQDKRYLLVGGDVTLHSSTATFFRHLSFNEGRAHMTGYFLNILSLEEIIKLEKGEGSLENCFTILGWTREILPQKHTPHADTAMKQCFPSHNCMFQCFKCLIEIKVFRHTSFMNTCQKRNLIQSSIDGINR